MAEGRPPVEPGSDAFPFPTFEAYGDRLRGGAVDMEWRLDARALYRVTRRADALRIHALYLSPFLGAALAGWIAWWRGDPWMLTGAPAFLLAWALARPWLGLLTVLAVLAVGLIPVYSWVVPLWLGLLPVGLLITACAGAALLRDVVLDASMHSPYVLAWLMERGTIRFVPPGTGVAE